MTEEEEEVTTVKFNVGGKLYEVSKSLLQRFPGTLLAKKASKASTTPIFIDRDPDRFAFCLDFMRDGGRLYLHDRITKSSMLQELRYLGFDDIDESLINDEASQKQLFVRYNDMVRREQQSIAEMQQELTDLTMKLRYKKIALICLQKSVQSFENEVTVKSPWIYRGKDVEEKIESTQINTRKYLSECFSKLGMEVLENRCPIIRFRKLSAASNPTGE